MNEKTDHDLAVWVVVRRVGIIVPIGRPQAVDSVGSLVHRVGRLVKRSAKKTAAHTVRALLHLLLRSKRWARERWRWSGRVPVATKAEGLVKLLADELGCEEKVVVVDNDKVSGAVHLCDLVGEELVGLLVRDPRGVGRRNGGGRVEPQEVVEKGPERCLSTTAKR